MVHQNTLRVALSPSIAKVAPIFRKYTYGMIPTYVVLLDVEDSSVYESLGANLIICKDGKGVRIALKQLSSKFSHELTMDKAEMEVLINGITDTDERFRSNHRVTRNRVRTA